MNTGKDVVDRIDILLTEKKLKRKELADYAGISIQAFTNWTSRGNFPSADVAIKIAEFLHVSVEYLITGTDPGKPDNTQTIAEIKEYTERIKEKLNTLK